MKNSSDSIIQSKCPVMILNSHISLLKMVPRNVLSYVSILSKSLKRLCVCFFKSKCYKYCGIYDTSLLPLILHVHIVVAMYFQGHQVAQLVEAVVLSGPQFEPCIGQPFLACHSFSLPPHFYVSLLNYQKRL